ncbi:MAG: hypothetical protein KJ571_08885 [Bacteroidetes bacterium]|nr:hypothetical protein [Bacteroidota bacterium]
MFKRIYLLPLIAMLLNSCSLFEFDVEIDANNPFIKYTGRIEFLDSANVKLSWSGVSIETLFEGTTISIKLVDGNNDYNVFIDDKLDTVLVTKKDTVYTLAKNLTDTLHHILITKRTEASLGEVIFSGFIINHDKNFYYPDKIKKRNIEFIGDSFVAGFGVEGLSPECLFERETENNYLAFGPILARRFNAEYFVEAISGSGIIRNFGDSLSASLYPFPYYYDRINIFDTTKWDFSNWIPDAVIIRIGNNDFWSKPYPTRSQFEKAYKEFILMLRMKYANTNLFCLSGAEEQDPDSEYINNVVDDLRINNRDKNIHFVKLDVKLNRPDDFGCQYHPNINGQKKIADFLEPIIREKMNWK